MSIAGRFAILQAMMSDKDPETGMPRVPLITMEYILGAGDDIFGPIGPKCECGAEKSNSPAHSSWCAKYET